MLVWAWIDSGNIFQQFSVDLWFFLGIWCYFYNTNSNLPLEIHFAPLLWLTRAVEARTSCANFPCELPARFPADTRNPRRPPVRRAELLIKTLVEVVPNSHQQGNQDASTTVNYQWEEVPVSRDSDLSRSLEPKWYNEPVPGAQKADSPRNCSGSDKLGVIVQVQW